MTDTIRLKPNLEGLTEEIPDSVIFEPLTIWKPSQILEYNPPKNINILGNGYLIKGEFTTLLGPGGIGKSRLSLQMALCQITGREWCGIPMSNEPLRWLFIGNENSIYRLKDDLLKMLSQHSKEERELIDEYLAIQVPNTIEDSFLSLESQSAQERIKLTLGKYDPQCVVFDPLISLQIGDESDTKDMKRTVKTIMRIVKSHNMDCAVLIVHHSRTGSENIKQGANLYDSGNFGRGSKVLFSACRCQINLMPGDKEDQNKLVLACGKANNAPHFKMRGLEYDPITGLYSVDGTFDLNDWINDVDGKRSNKAATINDVMEAIRAGNHKTSEITEFVIDITGASLRTVRDRIRDAVKADKIVRIKQGLYELKEDIN
jgi:hypothetical protein